MSAFVPSLTDGGMVVKRHVKHQSSMLIHWLPAAPRGGRSWLLQFSHRLCQMVDKLTRKVRLRKIHDGRIVEHSFIDGFPCGKESVSISDFLSLLESRQPCCLDLSALDAAHLFHAPVLLLRSRNWGQGQPFPAWNKHNPRSAQCNVFSCPHRHRSVINASTR